LWACAAASSQARTPPVANLPPRLCGATVAENLGSGTLLFLIHQPFKQLSLRQLLMPFRQVHTAARFGNACVFSAAFFFRHLITNSDIVASSIVLVLILVRLFDDEGRLPFANSPGFASSTLGPLLALRLGRGVTLPPLPLRQPAETCI
jgi:hypothetical protein